MKTNLFKFGFKSSFALYILAIVMATLGVIIGVIRLYLALAGICSLMLLYLTYRLYRFVDRTNRQTSYLLHSLVNDDFTLTFPTEASTPTLQRLYASLNLLNENIYQTKLQLQTKENYYQQILNRINIGILTYNESGHVVFCNPTFEQIVNYSPLHHIKQLNRVNQQLYQCVSSMKVADHELINLTNERLQKQFSLRSSSTIVDGKSIFIVLLQDINRALDEKETDSWDKLIRVLTHEIMNTITPITSISDSLITALNAHDEDKGLSFDTQRLHALRKGLEVIQSQSTNLTAFVQSYRSLLNIPKPDFTLFRVNQLFDSIHLMVTTISAPDSLKIVIDCHPPDLELYADKKQLTLVLQNLVKNALDALTEATQPTLQLRAHISNSGQKYLQVIDNGRGIESNLLDKVLIPFFTTKGNGTGVGLSVSKQIMRLHGGTLTVTSRPFEETIISLIF